MNYETPQRLLGRAARRRYYSKVRVKNPLIKLLNLARERSKKKGLEFNISLEDLNLPEFCPVLNIPLQVAKGRASWNSPSIDRIDPSKGYVKNNVRVISMRANLLKGNSTSEECRLLYEDSQRNYR